MPGFCLDIMLLSGCHVRQRDNGNSIDCRHCLGDTRCVIEWNGFIPYIMSYFNATSLKVITTESILDHMCSLSLSLSLTLTLTSHLSPLTSHLSPLTSHLSPLTFHFSLFNFHYHFTTLHLAYTVDLYLPFVVRCIQ